MSRDANDQYFDRVDRDGNLPRPRFFTDELNASADDLPGWCALLVDAGYVVKSSEAIEQLWTSIHLRWRRSEIGFVARVSLHDPTDPRYDGDWVINGCPGLRRIHARTPDFHAEVLG